MNRLTASALPFMLMASCYDIRESIVPMRGIPDFKPKHTKLKGYMKESHKCSFNKTK